MPQKAPPRHASAAALRVPGRHGLVRRVAEVIPGPLMYSEKMPDEKESAKIASKRKKADEAVPSLALLTLESPDGYYTYLSIEKSTEIEEELVKKNYRRLSLKHHPDRPGGDEETFRALNRAQRVLLHAKLRKQYDMLGLDLEEDEHHEHDGHEEEKKEDEPPTSPDTIVSHMASFALAAILQALIRTVMMGVVAVFVTRYWITVLIAVAFLAFIAYRVRIVHGAPNTDMLSPFMIAVGLLLMHKGRILPETTWSFTFWLGEALVVAWFTHNSLPPQSTPIIFVIILVVAFLLTLWLRGDMWKYLTLIILQICVAIVLAILFPIMEMLLEAILNEKLRKVGDKVRAHTKRMEAYYKAKQ